MSLEDAFNATKRMASRLATYVMAVAEKYGKEEAFELLKSTFAQSGRQTGDMLKQQLEGKEASALDISDLVLPGIASAGHELEKIEEGADKVTVKILRCAAYEGFQEAGAPAEEFCRYWAEPMMDALAKAINPKARWKFLKIRSSAEDYCLEQVIIE